MSQIINKLAQYGAESLSAHLLDLAEKMEAIAIMLEDINSQLKNMIKEEEKHGKEKSKEYDRAN
jgi:hypothetical protein